MKTITIGRGEGCHIIVDDEMMSRRHAIIKIPTFGGMEIVDMSKNGTFVNGVRLRPNVPFPVTRKDVVNFADVHQLDWSQVPDPLKYYRWGAMTVGGLVVLLLVIFLLKSAFSGSETSPTKPAVEQPVKAAPSVNPQEEPAAEPENADQQEPSEEAPEAKDPAGSQEAVPGNDDQVIDVYGAARASKKKREAEERARQQKAREQQKAKEQQQKAKEQQKKDADKSSGNNKTVVI